MNEFPRPLRGAMLPDDEYAATALDGAGLHTAHARLVPPNVTLLRLPAYSPELNSIERAWLYLRERYLSNRIHDGYTAIVDAVCHAWCKLDPERLRSLCGYRWIANVTP